MNTSTQFYKFSLALAFLGASFCRVWNFPDIYLLVLCCWNDDCHRFILLTNFFWLLNVYRMTGTLISFYLIYSDWFGFGVDLLLLCTEVEIQLPLKRSSRFQRLFPNPSWLVWGRASRHQKLAPTFPGIDSCLMVTKRDFSKWKRHYD